MKIVKFAPFAVLIAGLLFGGDSNTVQAQRITVATNAAGKNLVRRPATKDVLEHLAPNYVFHSSNIFSNTSVPAYVSVVYTNGGQSTNWIYYGPAVAPNLIIENGTARARGDVFARKQPNRTNTPARKLKSGSAVAITGRYIFAWYHVESSNGNVGYIDNSRLTYIQASN